MFPHEDHVQEIEIDDPQHMELFDKLNDVKLR